VTFVGVRYTYGMRRWLWAVIVLLVFMAGAGVVGWWLVQQSGVMTVPETALAPSPTIPVVTPAVSPPADAAVPVGEELAVPPPNFTVAFTGDQGLSENARAVLELIRQEGAEMTIVSGDLAYEEEDPASADRWAALITDVLGPEYPLFATIGNHDVRQWPGYRKHIDERLSRIPEAACEGILGQQAACRYQGLFFLQADAGTPAQYYERELANSDALWKICSWHYNQRAMQIGGKEDEMDWQAYEACREQGAIIATAHEHSYERTKTLTDIDDQVVSEEWPSGQLLRVEPGSTFVFVSGLGGHSIRDQERCLPAEPPYGCRGEWASIYTSNQDATYGALFIVFNVDGDPARARGYFKNIDGVVVDSFEITTVNIK